MAAQRGKEAELGHYRRYGQVLESRVIVMWESVDDNPVYQAVSRGSPVR